MEHAFQNMATLQLLYLHIPDHMHCLASQFHININTSVAGSRNENLYTLSRTPGLA